MQRAAGTRTSEEMEGPRPTTFEDIVKKHGEPLYRRALWLTKNEADASDLFQTTLERGIRAHGGRIPTAKIHNWLLTIMHNAFIDERRSSDFRARCTSTAVTIERLVQPDREAEALWKSYEIDDLERAMGSLSPSLRTTFVLRSEGLRQAEIARRLGVKLSTVGTRLMRARERLRDILAPKTTD